MEKSAKNMVILQWRRVYIIHLDEAVVVEGKYDEIKIKSIFDAFVIRTDGFGLYKDEEKMSLIRYFAEKSGIIILTDSDTAGFRIRRYIKGSVGEGKITNVYIPDVFGKEKRKPKPSKEGKIGVEGIDRDTILEAFRKAGIAFDGENRVNPDPITNIDMFELGLSGGKNSSEKRKAVIRHFGLPELLTSKSLVEVLNTLTTKEEFYKECEKIKGEN